ncbi:MAG: hypothetical protein FRX48_03701 [Lasallia pustulata]|uniref:Uncharacterized protein n=1 Tax=Lasallia pustulata TaxID=136370 RepID=A0A5M8PUJ1_9LECA|nr:MAG: hypothetical protein FRX48_03701 [Lasallia pustulata]
MSNINPPKKKKPSTDPASPPPAADPGSPHTPTSETRAKTPATPRQPPSNTAFPSSLPSAANSPTETNSANDRFGGAKAPATSPNKHHRSGSTPAPPESRLATSPFVPVPRTGPTSGSYGSKPLERGYATAGLGSTAPAEREEEATRGFGTRTEEGVGGVGGEEWWMGRLGELRRVVDAEREMEEAEGRALAEEIARAQRALVAEDEGDEGDGDVRGGEGGGRRSEGGAG